MAQIPDQILTSLPPFLRNILEDSSRRDLLRKTDTSFLIFDHQLIHLESGRQRAIPGTDVSPDPKVIAAISKSLLDSSKKECSAMLFVSPAEFVATSQSMPGVSKDNLASALQLQIDSILPAYDEPLSLAVNAGPVEQSDEHIAIWCKSSRMDEYFEAFDAEGIFLGAIKPRILKPLKKDSICHYLDQDQYGATDIRVKNGVLLRWSHIEVIDFDNDAFKTQWQNLTSNADSERKKEFKAVEDYLNDDAVVYEKSAYHFFPQGALSARKKVKKGRNLLAVAGIVAICLVISAIPFLAQSIEFRNLASSLDLQRVMAFEARQDQQVVVNFENEWGVISDFPDQQIRRAMYALQNVLSPDRLSSMEITEGLIKIQGTSSEPQALLQRLEQDPIFTEVIFSRATNNSRYYIDLRLSEVNFEAYMVRYFPDE
jgi:hypothetical protein